MIKRIILAWIIVASCLLALVKFTIRGPLLAAELSYDFKTFYAASRAWSDGKNPYDQKLLNSILEDAGASGEGFTWEEEPSICPPTTYAVLSPIAQLPWRYAKLLWCLLNVTSLIVLIVCLCLLMDFSAYGLRTLLLVAGVLALQPSSATLRVGQLSLVVAALGTAGLVLGSYGRESASGLLTGFALAIKSQLVLAFLVSDLISRRRRTCFVALLTMLAITCIAVLKLRAQAGWFGSWILNLRSAFGPSGVNSIEPSNPHHSNVINLQYPIRLIVKNVWGVNALALGVGAILVLPALRTLSYAEISAPARLQSVSLLAVVQLITVYHRDYDAVLLALPLAWALSPQVPPRRALPAILLIAVFFFPFLKVLYSLDQSTFRPFSTTTFWQVVVWPYQTWALLGLAAWLRHCGFRQESTSLSAGWSFGGGRL
jgi:hypothetical protein